MPSPEFQLNQPASSWDQFAPRLHALLVQIPPAPTAWPSAGKVLPSPYALAHDLEHGELPHPAEIESAIDGWTNDGKWPGDLSEAARFYLRLRIETAMNFALGFCVRAHEADTTIIPFPDLHVRAVARWLFVNWWECHGRMEACKGWIIEQVDAAHDEEEAPDA